MLLTRCHWKGTELTLLQRCIIMGVALVNNAEGETQAGRWQRIKLYLVQNIDLKDTDETVSIDEQEHRITITAPTSYLIVNQVNIAPYE